MGILQRAIKRVVPVKTSLMLLRDANERERLQKHVDALYDPSKSAYRVEQGKRQLNNLANLRIALEGELTKLEGRDDVAAYKRRKSIKKEIGVIEEKIKKVAFYTKLDELSPNRLKDIEKKSRKRVDPLQKFQEEQEWKQMEAWKKIQEKQHKLEELRKKRK